MPSHKADKGAFTPSNPSSSPPDLIYLGIKDRFPITLKLAVSDHLGTVPTDKKGNPLRNNFGRINRDHPELEAFNDNIGHNQSAPVTCRNNVYICMKALRRL